MTRRRVLLTGGAGYIGSHCALALEEAGIETVVYDDLSAGHREAVPGQLILGDIRDRRLLAEVLTQGGFDAVMHFAARLNVGESVYAPLSYYDVNVGGTLSLLQAMAASPTRRLVFSSTCAIYGDPTYVPVDERHPQAPVSPYGASKKMVEEILADARRKEGFQVISLRYFNAAGADPKGRIGEAHSPELHLIPLALDGATGRRRLQLFGRTHPTPDGTCIRDYIHVTDLANAHHLAFESLYAGSPGASYNLGTGKGTSVMEVIRAVERVTGRQVPVDEAPAREGDPAALFASNDQIRACLGWNPHYMDIHEIVETAWNWYQSPRF